MKHEPLEVIDPSGSPMPTELESIVPRRESNLWGLAVTCRTAAFALPIMLMAFGQPSSAMDGETSEGQACERFAEHFIRTGGQIDQASRQQCNAGPHAECDYIRQSLQKNVGNDDEKLNRYFFSLLPCGDALYVDPHAP